MIYFEGSKRSGKSIDFCSRTTAECCTNAAAFAAPFRAWQPDARGNGRRKLRCSLKGLGGKEGRHPPEQTDFAQSSACPPTPIPTVRASGRRPGPDLRSLTGRM